MDRELSSKYLWNQKLKRLSVIVIIVIAIIISLLVFKTILKSDIKRSRIRTAFTELGSIEATVTASGIVIPEYEQVITAPINTKILGIHHKSGEKVSAGEPIIELDKEFLQLEYNRIKNEYELQKNKKLQLSLKLERSIIELQTMYEIQELQIDSYKSKLDMERHLNEIGAGTKESLRLAELNLEIARRELKRLSMEIDNKQKSSKADLNELELQISIQEDNLNQSRRQMELAEASAGRDGVITWINDNIGSSINSGEEIARVADLSSFKVKATISEINASKLIIGNRIIVRIGELKLRGTISGIQPSIENGIVTFIVELQEKSNQVLRPNLRVDVFVVASFKDNVIRIENGPFVNGSGKQDIFVIDGDKATRRNVVIGAMNFDYVEIENNIEVGKEVIISNMEDYIHISEIDIVND
ncbi:MAG: efflux RND transporter periplasmic adaptor subunit [candidate division Zixibacteria bacterium]|nr:efflux RND transporter periplasmic adaptor subunit [candidate division Zixibacteria bacterium]